MITIGQNCDKLMLIKNHSIQQSSQNGSIQIHRKFFPLSLFISLALSTSVFAKDCYLFISSDRKYDKSALDQQIRPLLTNYLSVEIKDVGIAGLSIGDEQHQKEYQ